MAGMPVANLRTENKMRSTLCQVGDALLGQLARVFVLFVALLIPTMAKSICWDYSDEEMGPLVPEWSSEPDTNVFNWSARRAEFAYDRHSFSFSTWHKNPKAPSYNRTPLEAMAEPDDLFTLKNQLWVGNYQNALSEGNMLNHLGESLRNERDVYVYRAQLALGNFPLVLQSIPDAGNTPIALSAVKLWATYLSGQGDKEMIDLTLKEWLADPTSGENAQLLLIAGQIYAREGKLSDALSALTRGGSLEHMLYIVHLYLQMDRLDLGQKTVQEMKKIEEDSTLTQLAQAWCLTLQGGDKADEATLHFQELADRFGSTPLLLNGAAAAFMALKNYVEAERLLLEAVQKDPSNEDTLINLIAVSAHLSKPTHQYIMQLQQVAPSSSWLENYVMLDRGFSEMAATFA